MKSSVILRGIFAILGLLGILFILLPILHIFFSSSLKAIKETLKEKELWKAIWVSISAAGISVIIAFILGIPVGYAIARINFPGKRFLESLTNLPIAIPHVAVGIALLSLLNEKTLLGKFFKTFHISFVDTFYGVVVAMLFVSFSFVISASITGFSAVSKELEMVSRSLGAGPTYTFLRITFPLAFPSILRGGILAFARAISEVGALLILAYYPKTASIFMYERFEEFGLDSATPVTIVVIVCCLIIFFSMLYLSRKFFKGLDA
ncbi:MAG: ABC transporter permease [Thermodesulfobacteria bacterium]|nr:ABC transporter permease [Thermodesulfobacteriota bacterium]